MFIFLQNVMKIYFRFLDFWSIRLTFLTNQTENSKARIQTKDFQITSDPSNFKLDAYNFWGTSFAQETLALSRDLHLQISTNQNSNHCNSIHHVIACLHKKESPGANRVPRMAERFCAQSW